MNVFVCAIIGNGCRFAEDVKYLNIKTNVVLNRMVPHHSQRSELWGFTKMLSIYLARCFHNLHFLHHIEIFLKYKLGGKIP